MKRTLTRKQRIIRNLLILLLIAGVMDFLIADAFLIPEKQFRREERGNIVGPSTILGQEKIDLGPFQGMILGETSLSFLGLGLRPPVVSWGVMLQDCMNVKAVIDYPWLLAPVVMLVFAVLCFNFLGDGLRDAADPYASK